MRRQRLAGAAGAADVSAGEQGTKGLCAALHTASEPPLSWHRRLKSWNHRFRACRVRMSFRRAFSESGF